MLDARQARPIRPKTAKAAKNALWKLSQIYVSVSSWGANRPQGPEFQTNRDEVGM